MSTSVNTIKWLLWLLLGVFILTYLIALNIENHFIVANTKWLSNDFVFAFVGGAFASLVIVLICEFIKYRQLKFATETTLFSNIGNLYGHFLIIRSNCQRALNSMDIVADNLIEPICDNAKVVIDYINRIDYMPFRRKNKVKELLVQFSTDKQLTIKTVLSSFIFLRIAINEDKIALLQQKKPDQVTSGCPNTKLALEKVISQTSTILAYLDKIITQIDHDLGDKFHWQNMKQVLNTYQDIYIDQTLEDYLKEDVTVF